MKDISDKLNNKNPRGKPSRLTLDFLVTLESGVF